MRSTSSIAAEVVAWARTVLAEVQTSNDYPTTENPGRMPHLSIDVLRITPDVAPPGNAPPTAHRQSVGRLLEMTLEVLVQPLPPGPRSQELWSMADRLIDAQRLDRTLGATLHATPIACSLPGHVTLGDETIALALQASLSVWVTP